MFSASDVHAMEWRPESTVGTEIEYTDNLYMDSENPTAETFLYGNAVFRLRGESDTTRILLNADVHAQRLQRTRRANNEFYTAGVACSRFFEQGEFSIETQYNETSTRAIDLETIGVTPNFIFGKQRSVTFHPRVEYDANETNRLAFAVRYDDIRYDLPNYTDYTNTNVQFNWFHSLNDRIELNTQMQVQRYDSRDNLVDHEYGSLLAVLNNEATDRWHLQIGAGLGYLVRTFGNNYRTFLGRFSATRLNEQSEFVIRAESSLQPTSSARLSRLSRFTLGYRLSISELSNINSEFGFSRSNIIDASPSYDNDLLRVGIGYHSRLNERLDWNARYAFINNLTSRDNLSRISNSIFLSLTLAFDHE